MTVPSAHQWYAVWRWRVLHLTAGLGAVAEHKH